MILTCPSCTMRYLVSEGAVGPNGRRVKCAHCGHQWFQDGEEGLDEALFGPADDAFAAVDVPAEEIEIDFSGAEQVSVGDFQSILQKEIETVSIPEGVKPTPQEDLVIPPSKGKKKSAGSGKIGGFAAAALIFVMAFGTLLLMQPQISRAWPPSNMIYNLFGMKPVPPGEGLSLANLQAKFDGKQVTMMGDINNLKSEELKVPAVMASFIDMNDKVLDRVLIPPPAETVKGEGHLAFDVVHPSVPDGATNVTFAFTYLKAESSKEESADEEKAEHEEPKADDHAPSHEEPSAKTHTAPDAH